MALKINPVTGMRDMLPGEARMREYVLRTVKDTYASFGFSMIETPCVEHMENLSSRQGGDNEKLIFRILKRGEKLRLEDAASADDLSDEGLRYDLTVPLARYYAAHANELPSPFKAMQTGNVWRADRPQKGRFRQFTQCDIDILGEAGNLAEIELITATASLLGKLGFEDFTVHINDRRILAAIAKYSGFREEDCDDVFVILDKTDKIGREAVAEELAHLRGYGRANADACLGLIGEIERDALGVRFCGEKLAGYLDGAVADGLESIIDCVRRAGEAKFDMVFDPTLVRGQSYYTGTIFEIRVSGFDGSVAGGGRYDKMIGRFTGQDTPACGFSIGFERIVMLLAEKGRNCATVGRKKAYLLDKNLGNDDIARALEAAKNDRASGIQTSVVNMRKNKKFQKEQLYGDGYTEIIEIYKDKGGK